MSSNNKNWQVNLTQSYEVDVCSESKVKDVIASHDFQTRLDTELMLGKLELIGAENKPTFHPPNLNEDDKAAKVEQVKYNVKHDEGNSSLAAFGMQLIGVGFQLKKGADMQQQLETMVNNAVKKKGNEDLKSEMQEIKESNRRIYARSHYPKLLRQLIKELKIQAINKKYPTANLHPDNPVFMNKGYFNFDAFETTYKGFCDAIYTEIHNKMDEPYLQSLFTYPLEEFNIALHEDLLPEDEQDLKAAVEMKIQGDFSKKPNDPLVRFFNKWKETINPTGPTDH